MTVATHYHGSRGPIEIATMPYPFLRNARDKLARSRIEDERQGELDAMSARLEALEAEHQAAQADTVAVQS